MMCCRPSISIVARSLAGENAPRQGIPLDWVRGVERLLAYRHMPAAASMGRFSDDFGQFIHGRGGWAERAADLGFDTLPCSDVIQRARWTT
jgi:hypothetical protein